ncbi:MAG: TerC family protein [Saprospiraceae bacterium]|nr:TerC family protein [Saprospiraceae bacterium]
MEWITNPDLLIAFFTLTFLEIVLGIDNIIFISILTGRLPAGQQAKARRVGIGLAMFMRIGLVFSISWLMRLTAPLLTVAHVELSGRDLILLLGGLFLLYKSVKEIHNKVEEAGENELDQKRKISYASVITQILVVDLVFSLDSVITAVGMVEDISVMIAAIVVSVAVMMLSATPISNFVQKHPAVKILALAFLILIGVSLIGEALDFHIPKGYIYFARAFSVAVEAINIQISSRSKK